MCRKFTIGLSGLLLLASGLVERGAALARTPASSSGTLLWISDVHFDPYAGGQVLRLADPTRTRWRDHSQWSAILKRMPANQASAPAGRDANEFLFQTVLSRAASQCSKKPDGILITGDFLAHDFSASYFNKQQLPAALASVAQFNRFVDQTLAHLASSVSRTFPGVPVVASLGNNDAYCGDYGVRGNSGFLSATHRTFRRYFLPELSTDFVKYGGCYATQIPGTQHRFVVLNSVPFLSDYPEAWSIEGIPSLTSRCQPLRNVELVDEMDWLSRTVAASRPGQRAWIVCHIPPGVACYDGTQNWSRPVTQAAKQRPFVDVFSGELARTGSVDL